MNLKEILKIYTLLYLVGMGVFAIIFIYLTASLGRIMFITIEGLLLAYVVPLGMVITLERLTGGSKG